jgi:hypothetical protein
MKSKKTFKTITITNSAVAQIDRNKKEKAICILK